MKYIVILVVLFGCGCATTTRWVGHPVTAHGG